MWLDIFKYSFKFLKRVKDYKSLYNAAKSYFVGDEEAFKMLVRKDIANVCKEAIDKFPRSSELKGIISSDAHEIISDEVIKALDNATLTDIDAIQKRLGIPKDNKRVFGQLMKNVNKKLHKSTNYTQRDNRARLIAMQEMLEDIKKDTGLIPDMAKKIDDLYNGIQPTNPSPKRTNIASRPFQNPPYIENLCFAGRKETLRQIHTKLKSGNAISLTQTLVGMGGFGKTQTALKYAYMHEGDYSLIWWVKAETDASVIESYKNFAERMGLIGEDEHNRDVIIAHVFGWMHANQNWLFVYDNIVEIKDDTPWFPRNNKGNILITTRNQQCNIGENIDIDVFKESEAIEFLTKRTGITGEDKGAKNLAHRLGYFPLALEQAAAYINANKISYSKYLSLLKSHSPTLFGNAKNMKGYKKSVKETLELAVDSIESKAAKQLLYLCSYVAPENIDEAMFSCMPELLPSPLKEEMQDEIKRMKTWEQLTQYSLVKKQEDGNYAMHRLLQEVVRDKIKNDTQYALSCLDIFCETYEFEWSNKASHDMFLQRSPHVQAFMHNTTAILTDDESQKKFGFLYNRSGFGYDYLGDYGQALALYKEALIICEKVWGREHVETAVTYNNIADVYTSQGDYDQAIKWHEKSLAIREKVWGEDHLTTTVSYNNIAGMYHDQGDYDKALEWYEKALAIREDKLGEDHPDTAKTYNNIGVVYSNQGDYNQALKWFKKALKIQEEKLDKDHLDKAVTYNNIGLVYDYQGDYNQALELYQKALDVHQKILDPNHPSVQIIKENIAIAQSLLSKK